MKQTLEEIRSRIDAIDKEMVQLFSQRMLYSREVVDYKMSNGLAICNAQREKDLLERNSSFVEDDTIREYYIQFQKNLMSLSKDYQSRIMNGMKVAYSGLPGAFGHIAALNMFKGAQLINFEDFASAYEACENGTCDSVVLPMENSFAGEVSDVADLMFNGSLFINQVLALEAVQNLVAIEGASVDSIKDVVSHPQALSQCADYIKRHNFQTHEFPNTARAAKFVSDKDDPSIAAIASRECAELYGLKIIEDKINSSGLNTTRFAAFSRVQNTSSQKKKSANHFMLMFTVKNEAGSLAKTLNIIGSHGYNMCSLRSRPMKNLLWNYYFYLELEGNVHSEEGSDMMRELGTICDRLKLLGSF